MDLERFTGYVRRCADDYQMLESGDRVAVGVSGGKDSMALLAALRHLRRNPGAVSRRCAEGLRDMEPLLRP